MLNFTSLLLLSVAGEQTRNLCPLNLYLSFTGIKYGFVNRKYAQRLKATHHLKSVWYMVQASIAALNMKSWLYEVRSILRR